MSLALTTPCVTSTSLTLRTLHVTSMGLALTTPASEACNARVQCALQAILVTHGVISVRPTLVTHIVVSARPILPTRVVVINARGC